MAELLHADERPCASCPYRLDCPSGVWHPEEYDKLRRYSDEPNVAAQTFGVFLCHYSVRGRGHDVPCRGWLTVEADSVAARMNLAEGILDPDDVYAEPTVPLHPTGTAAAEHGMRDIDHPSTEALRLIERLERTTTTRRQDSR